MVTAFRALTISWQCRQGSLAVWQLECAGNWVFQERFKGLHQQHSMRRKELLLKLNQQLLHRPLTSILRLSTREKLVLGVVEPLSLHCCVWYIWCSTPPAATPLIIIRQGSTM